MARRAFTSLKGGYRWFIRNTPMLPSGSAISTLMLRFFLSIGTRSAIGFSHQSTSPFCSAAAPAAGSRVTPHLLASGEPGRLLLPRHVIGKPLKNRLGAGHPLAFHELHWARARIFG